MKCQFWTEVQKYLVRYYQKAGIEQQILQGKFYKVTKTYHYKDDNTGSEYILEPSSEFKIDVQINYNSKVFKYLLHNSIAYQILTKISNARTFVFLHEIKNLFEQGLIKGGSLNNAIVFVEERVSSKELLKLAKIFNKKDIDVKEQGILNNLELRYENEPVRHKLLRCNWRYSTL